MKRYTYKPIVLVLCLALICQHYPTSADKSEDIIIKKLVIAKLLKKFLKKKIIPLPIPVPILPFVLLKLKKELNRESEVYFVKEDTPRAVVVGKYVKYKGGIDSLYA